jgi:hypothetical protein
VLLPNVTGGAILRSGVVVRGALALRALPAAICLAPAGVVKMAAGVPKFPGTKTIDTRKVLPPPGGRQFADPAKVAARAAFDWAKYQPIIVEETKGGLRYVVDGMTRIENAQKAGIMHLPAIIRRI